jgi:DNA-binding MarR family transcriptional regulator
VLSRATTPDRAEGAPEGPSTSPGFQMWSVTLAWQREIKAALRPYDLTHVQFVLLASTWWLGGTEAPPTQTRLAEHARTDLMMTSQVLRRLEDKQLVRRYEDKVDTRAKRVSLTAEGRELLLRSLPAVDAADAAFFAPVSRPELLRTLKRLNRNEDER